MFQSDLCGQGGRIIYSGDVLDQVIDAASNFSNQNTDTKAQMQIIFIIEDGQVRLQRSVPEYD